MSTCAYYSTRALLLGCVYNTRTPRGKALAFLIFGMLCAGMCIYVCGCVYMCVYIYLCAQFMNTSTLPYHLYIWFVVLTRITITFTFYCAGPIESPARAMLCAARGSRFTRAAAWVYSWLFGFLVVGIPFMLSLFTPFLSFLHITTTTLTHILQTVIPTTWCTCSLILMLAVCYFLPSCFFVLFLHAPHLFGLLLLFSFFACLLLFVPLLV
jgi:hypothetical protein